ncbi:unnamed protein product [Nezara viridula]|uniref:Uncharacterized protein n=1 Tax=Nezara viridula TaxID=85310 RepID=A0A9P0EHA7_NEZVI|nr:unnamed protein product [Nezara viridula]
MWPLAAHHLQTLSPKVYDTVVCPYLKHFAQQDAHHRQFPLPIGGTGRLGQHLSIYEEALSLSVWAFFSRSFYSLIPEACPLNQLRGLGIVFNCDENASGLGGSYHLSIYIPSFSGEGKFQIPRHTSLQHKYMFSGVFGRLLGEETLQCQPQSSLSVD